ncbi:hypothetical protein H0H87_001475, partial [Tephrocybe sp. NHM501043]
SGHGGQTKDLNGDELDGFDEGSQKQLPSALTLVLSLTETRSNLSHGFQEGRSHYR